MAKFSRKWVEGRWYISDCMKRSTKLSMGVSKTYGIVLGRKKNYKENPWLGKELTVGLELYYVYKLIPSISMID